MKHILALDQGTTSSRAILFDRAGGIVAVAQKEFPQIFPKPGWVEHDPRDIWSTQAGVAAEVLTKANSRRADVAAIGITNQRETDSSGTARPDSRFATRSSGRIGVRHPSATGSRRGSWIA